MYLFSFLDGTILPSCLEIIYGLKISAGRVVVLMHRGRNLRHICSNLLNGVSKKREIQFQNLTVLTKS